FKVLFDAILHENECSSRNAVPEANRREKLFQRPRYGPPHCPCLGPRGLKVEATNVPISSWGLPLKPDEQNTPIFLAGEDTYLRIRRCPV
ncbi:hypothetical protein, partial [Olavius algarvensis spirochete endosymbiont]|uniref:hypothetical protein n=1 Tax=Olavius algarvensis spirochete endosymbiont TaxID=260710 RepID=UPI001E40C86B